ncbi:MAG: helix-turn-helix domain-containing protein [Oceanospirillaceae bacterium]|nr:helix-turn-helix domain-containing protein [Oceanospirillaceae bacterium]
MATNVVCKTMLLLELLMEQGSLGLEELHILSNQPKSTVKRLMDDLVELGWVHRRLGDRRYTPLKGVPEPLQRRARLASRFAPLLEELHGRTGFSSDIALDLGGGLEVVESNFSLRGGRKGLGTLIGLRPHLQVSAMGRAYADGTALCEKLPDAERHALEQERRRGYYRRVPRAWEYPFEPPFDIRAVAVPIRRDAITVGTLNLYWDEQRYGDAGCGDPHLAQLESAVERIASMLSGT